jgi:hypothetical protein
MQTTRQKRWERALAGLARHPRRAALAATVLLVVFAALIRAPVIEGSMVDRIAGGNAQLDVARRISAAGGGLSRVAVIATPRAVPIDAVMADVARLRSDLGAVDPRIELQ